MAEGYFVTGRRPNLMLGVTKNFFSGGVVRQWHRLPREVLESLSLEIFKKRVDVAMRTMLLCARVMG